MTASTPIAKKRGRIKRQQAEQVEDMHGIGRGKILDPQHEGW
jgi:hypothetical protein